QRAGEHDMADAAPRTDLDEIEELWMKSDEVDAERPIGEGERRADFGVEQIRRHRPASDDTEAAAVGDRGHQMSLRHPGHGAAHDGEIGPQGLAAAAPELR